MGEDSSSAIPQSNHVCPQISTAKQDLLFLTSLNTELRQTDWWIDRLKDSLTERQTENRSQSWWKKYTKNPTTLKTSSLRSKVNWFFYNIWISELLWNPTHFYPLFIFADEQIWKTAQKHLCDWWRQRLLTIALQVTNTLCSSKTNKVCLQALRLSVSKQLFLASVENTTKQTELPVVAKSTSENLSVSSGVTHLSSH